MKYNEWQKSSKGSIVYYTPGMVSTITLIVNDNNTSCEFAWTVASSVRTNSPIASGKEKTISESFNAINKALTANSINLLIEEETI